MELTILTPTYNRCDELLNLYQSLCKQTTFQFEWLVIDDGSVDQTKNSIESLKDKSPFLIRYVYKENGGKHTALNVGISKIENEFTFIVDSDDILTPNAVFEILKTREKIIEHNLCGVSFLKGYNSEKTIGDDFQKVKEICNLLKVRSKLHIKGDNAEVWKTCILKKYPFPEYPNEKFIGESVVWNQISKDYDMLFVNKIVYIAKYLEDGLSKQGRRLRITCPLGGMANSKTYFKTNKTSLKDKIKNMWLFICYGKFANRSTRQIIKESGYLIFTICNLPFGIALYWFWKYRYGR